MGRIGMEPRPKRTGPVPEVGKRVNATLRRNRVNLNEKSKVDFDQAGTQPSFDA